MTDLLEATEAEAKLGEWPEPIVLPGIEPMMTDRLTRGIRKRRSVPIMGYVGLNGQGKSFAAVRDTLPSLALGRRVLSTVELLDPHSGNPHPLYVPFRSWSQLDDWAGGDILLDEITGVMDSRDGQSGMPKHIRRLLPQMRRRNAPIRWTGIDWDNTERRLRQLTQAVAMCRGYVPNHRVLRADGSRDVLAMWAPNRLFSIVSYDAQTMTQSSDTDRLTQETQKKRRVKVLNREWVKGPGSVAFRAYNTLGEVFAVDASCDFVNPVTGEICGGRIPEKVCRGH